MVNTNNSYSEYSQRLQTQATQELAQLLWQEEEVSYPWNPLAPESEAFFAELEQEFTLEDWSSAEIGTRSQAFFSGIDQLWSEIVPAPILQRVQASLSERFACRVPSHWLDAIATKASELIDGFGYPAPALSLMDRMVECVQELLPNWAEDDLQVLARPLAYAMRGIEAQTDELALAAVRPLDWNELSEIERARLSLAIARIAIDELEATDE
jgi:hypothetical protein